MSYLLAQASAHRIPLRDESVQTCVTSPPYWGLRAYAGEQSFVWGGEDHEHEWGAETRKRSSGIAGTPRPGNEYDASLGRHCPCGAWYGALGLEPTPALFVAHMVEVFREVRRVLRKDGTLWLNLGDSYAGASLGGGGGSFEDERPGWSVKRRNNVGGVLKPKDLVGIPWRVAFALQADGWYLRSDIIWAKPNPMPESVTDRPTKSHEYVFLLSKSQTYYYDADAIREVAEYGRRSNFRGGGAYVNQEDTPDNDRKPSASSTTSGSDPEAGRNARSVWNIATQPYPGAHFATFPEELPERCIKAGSAAQACAVCGAPWRRVTEREFVKTQANNYAPEHRGLNIETRTDVRERGRNEITTLGFEPTCGHDAPTVGSVVLDPFNGSGTTGRVAMRLGRRYVGLDMSREYLVEQAVARIDPIAASRRDFANGVEQSQGVLL